MAIYDSTSGGSPSETLNNMMAYWSYPSGGASSNSGVLQRRNTSAAAAAPTLVSNGSTSITTAALAWISTAAVGLLLLQWMGSSASAKIEYDEEESSNHWWLTRTILQALGLNPETKALNNNRSRAGKVLLHRGSCQCGSITFKLTPPRTVSVLQNYAHLGKLQYPTARVPSDQLQLTSGKNLWNTYHVQSDDGDIWAFSFCRSCATQLLHATEADQSSLFVNVQCFHENSGKPKNSVHNTAYAPGDENSVGTKNSVLTTVTTLPNFADPRLFAQRPQSSSIPSSDGSDSSPPTTRKKHQSSSSRGNTWKQHQPDLVTYVESDADSVEPIRVEQQIPSRTSSSSRKYRNHPQREVVTYSRRVDAYAKMNARLSGSTPPRSPPAGFPVAPRAEWPTNDNDHILLDDSDVDEDGSISSHSGNVSKEYSATATTVTSSSASIDYNISASRENMLHNMRKHLRK